MDIEIIKTLSVFSILQMGIWAFFLVKYKKANSEQRKFLLMITVIFAVFIAGIILLVYGRNSIAQFAANMSNTSILLVLPLLYQYIVGIKKQIAYILHFIPFLFWGVITLFVLNFNSAELISYNTYAILLISSFYIQCIVYFIMLYRKAGIKLFTPHHEKKGDTKEFHWFRPFLKGFSVIILFKISIFVVWNIFQLEGLCVFLSSIFLLASFIIVNTLILLALLNKERIMQVNKYESLSINDNEIENVYERIMDVLVLKKEYRNPLINLTQLSKKTGIPSNRISMVINEKTGKNLNELINKHRIEDAQEIMKQQRSQSKILDIAFEVGFNSKSTFNTAFKKYTGFTPSEFKLKIS